VAIADDAAFAFRYSHIVDGWERSGSRLTFFSPLADEAPAEDADMIYLPGGYPELYADRLAANTRFFDGVRRAARRGTAIFGECGGYMVLGEYLIDASGTEYRMAGLLPLVTSMVGAHLHLGYRQVQLAVGTSLGRAGTAFRGHEFHYARIEREGPGQPLFTCRDAHGTDCGNAGLADGPVAGSFVHLIDSADAVS
jgi:cobyrinic acid a,c-diamide synthase